MPATVSRLASSRVPNPSSRKIDSSRAAPWAASPDIWADSANASARLAWKVSPPDRVFTGLRASASVWSTTRNSPFSWVSSNWPPESSARLTDASATSASSADATSHRGKPSERRRWPSIFATCWASTAASRSAVSRAAAARRSTTRACAPRARSSAVATAVAAAPETTSASAAGAIATKAPLAGGSLCGRCDDSTAHRCGGRERWPRVGGLVNGSGGAIGRRGGAGSALWSGRQRDVVGGEVVEDPPGDGATAGRDRRAALRGPVCIARHVLRPRTAPRRRAPPTRATRSSTERRGVEGDQRIAGRPQLRPRGGDLALHGRRRVFGGPRRRPRRPQRGVGGPDARPPTRRSAPTPRPPRRRRGASRRATTSSRSRRSSCSTSPLASCSARAAAVSSRRRRSATSSADCSARSAAPWTSCTSR